MAPETITKLISIVFACMLLAQAYLIRLIVGTYLIPAALMCLAWFAYCVSAMVFLFDVPVDPISILFLVACISAFSLGATPFDWKRAFRLNGQKSESWALQFESGFLVVVFFSCSALSVVSSTLSLVGNGISISSLLSDVVRTSAKFATMRGKGLTSYGFWGVVSSFSTYGAALLGGLVFERPKRLLGRMGLLFLAIAPSVYYMLIQSTKLILFYSMGFFISSILLRKIYRNRLKIINLYSALRIGLLAIVLIPFLGIAFVSRDGYHVLIGSDSLKAKLTSTISSYAFAEVYAFADFFAYYRGAPSESIYINDPYSNGYYTFKPVFDALGGTKYFPPGTFVDNYSHKESIATNIFTIFRGLINDYGAIGTILFMFIAGIVVHFFYKELLERKDSWVGCGAFAITIVFIQGSYLFSIFTSRIMFLMFVSFILILWINERQWKKMQL
jgi:oligosaccharide repeat unit polymerase